MRGICSSVLYIIEGIHCYGLSAISYLSPNVYTKTLTELLEYINDIRGTVYLTDNDVELLNEIECFLKTVEGVIGLDVDNYSKTLISSKSSELIVKIEGYKKNKYNT